MLRSAIKLTMLLGTLTLAAGVAAAAEVYKYTDEKGNAQYTDKPRTLPAQRMAVQTKKPEQAPPAASSASSVEELKRMQDAQAARNQAQQQKTNDGDVSKLSAKDRAERCTKARDRYDTYINSRKLYESLPNGERRYLTSEELDSARATAKNSMDVWCK